MIRSLCNVPSLILECMVEKIDSEDADKDRVHIIYGMSKVFSVPGFRAGVLYSFNENVLAASRKFSRFSSVSTPTQLLVSVLSATNFTREYIKMNKQRIWSMCNLFVAGLRELGLECTESNAGLYSWVDMSRLISPYSEKGELDLWDKLLNIAKINVTPGSACHCIEPGWFRFCFTTLNEKGIPIVVDRIRKVVERCKPTVLTL